MIPHFPLTEPSDPPWIHPRAAYVHIPFCAHQCGYCDFAIATGKDDRIHAYLDALALEMISWKQRPIPSPLATLFVGGGTPSHLNLGQLARLCDLLHHALPVQLGAEVSIEANPESLSAEKVKLLAEAGWSRISLGAQSFSKRTLKNLDRPHDPDAVRNAVSLVKAANLDVSLDLIFGAPDQTSTDWQADLVEAIALGTDHISTYGLTYEKGTPLEKRVRLGMVRPIGEELERTMYSMAMESLGGAGYEHYEISNFAKPNKRCRHNEIYWANDAHLGFGMGAAGFVGLTRNLNTRELERYIRQCFEGSNPAFQSETLEPRERVIETMIQNLRRASGIESKRFFKQTGFEPNAFFKSELDPLGEQGFLAVDEQGFRLSYEGKFVADAVMKRLIRCL